MSFRYKWIKLGILATVSAAIYMLFVISVSTDSTKNITKPHVIHERSNFGPPSTLKTVVTRTTNINVKKSEHNNVNKCHLQENFTESTQQSIENSATWVTAFLNFHVYSATVFNGKIVLTGITSNSNEHVFCHTYYRHGSSTGYRVLHAVVEVIPETHGTKFVPVLISCSLPMDLEPIAVAVVHKECDKPRHIIAVQKRPANWKPTHNLTICPAPWNRHYKNVGEFLQYVEVNGLFGADYFMFYNHTVSAELQPFIDHYTQRGTIEVLQWKIPVETKQGPRNEIHYFGQVIAQADCFLRALLHSRFVACIDMDEVFLPMQGNEVFSVMGDDPKIGAFVFPNVFFRKEWDQDPTFKSHDLMKKYPVDALLYTQREPRIWPHGQRSKYIARPEAVTMASIHSPLRMNTQYKSKSISSDKALLAHYRNWEDFREAKKIKEKRAHDFSTKILERLQRIDQAVRKV